MEMKGIKYLSILFLGVDRDTEVKKKDNVKDLSLIV